MFKQFMLSALLISALPAVGSQEPDGEIELMLNDCLQLVKTGFNKVTACGNKMSNYFNTFENVAVENGKNILKVIFSRKLFTAEDSEVLADDAMCLSDYVDNNIGSKVAQIRDQVSNSIPSLVENSLRSLQGEDIVNPSSVDNVSLDSYIDSNIGSKVAQLRDQVSNSIPSLVENSLRSLEGEDIIDSSFVYNASLDSYVDSNISTKSAQVFDRISELVVNSFTNHEEKQEPVVSGNNEPKIDKVSENSQPIVLSTQPSWYSKIWNAEIAGYQGAGKYVVGSAVVVTAAIVAAYYAGLFSSKPVVSIEDQVEDLILQAQDNPNIVITELPKILAVCENDQVRLAVVEFVLANVEITSEIQAAFGL